ncbi:MAG TPA: helix-turn-helix transcriptional regulator [Polyangiaceae bacterium]|jgi:transcriptional regulator with XRE-family HTH domain|nr:helix-turn-helix transcriptional regulator [Polyangiaceae bacterium]
MASELEPFYEELGKRIQGYRKRAGMTQEDLGKAIDPPLTRASLANIENAKQRVLAHTIIQLAAALSVPVQDLLPALPRQQPERANLEKELAAKLSLSKTKARAMAQRLQRTGGRTK